MTLLYPPRPGETLGHLNISRPMLVERLNRRHGRVKLPKLGWVRFRMSRPLDEVVIRSVTVAREGRHWFVSFLVEDGVITAAVHAAPHAVVGVDRGVAAAIAISAGELIDREFLSVGERRRAMALQRRLSRSARRGRNREKTRAALGDIRARERQRRQDFCAQAAAQLTSANALVVIEDLKTKNMTRSAKGSLEQPGAMWQPSPGSTVPSWPRAGISSRWHCPRRPATRARRWCGCRQPIRRNAAHLVGGWIRNPVRAKRYSGAPPVATGRCTRTSTPPRTFWPQGLRSPPVESHRP
jgi:putative transposase